MEQIFLHSHIEKRCNSEKNLSQTSKFSFKQKIYGKPENSGSNIQKIYGKTDKSGRNIQKITEDFK